MLLLVKLVIFLYAGVQWYALIVESDEKTKNLLIWSNLTLIGKSWIMAHILATVVLKFKKKKKKKKKKVCHTLSDA